MATVVNKHGARSWGRVALAVAFFGVGPIAHAGDDDIHAGQRPVLCTWGIYVEMAKYGSVCGLAEHREFLDALDANIARIDSFILRNSDYSRDQLDDWQTVPPDIDASICEADSEVGAMFESFLDHPIAEMNAETDALIAVDRPPIADPCL